MREERHKSSSERRASVKKADDADNDSGNDSRKIERQKKKLEERKKAARMAKILAERDREENERDSGDEFNNNGYGAAKPVSDYSTEETVSAGLRAEDLQSRNSEGRKAQKKTGEKADTEVRRNAYQNAVNKAEDAYMALREKDGAEFPVYVGDEDKDFYRSLDRDRQAALKNQRNSVNPNRVAESVVARLASLQQEAVSSSQPPAGVESQEARLVFTAAGELCRSLQLDDAIVRRAGPKDVYGNKEEEAPVEKTEEGTSNVGGGWTEIVEVGKKHPVGEEETDSGDPVEESIAEVSVGRGLAGALSLLKQRGTLKEIVDWGGRSMDKKRSKLVGVVDESNDQIGQRDIVLERVDEFGRTMTPKEVFRRISHMFHGRGPGKKKQEKKIKQFHEELRLKQMNSGETPLLSMEKIREAQARMHTPYIVISGHIKPDQTSDPRSRFGSVEKEPIGSLTPMLGDKSAGSLTPMLGDKKVEHFLGIKRKSDAGSKDTPPKQSKFEHRRLN